jgi:hypothetical protein
MQELIKHLKYDCLTGVLTWIDGKRVGKQAGCLKRQGYLVIRHDGKDYMAHRVVWYMHHGSEPDGSLDHINRDKTDNRIDNLRISNPLAQAQNRRHSGVRKRKKPHHAHQVSISVDGKVHYVGSEFCPVLAHMMYIDAKRKIHPNYVG